MVTARRIHKTPQMQLIEEQHRRCCGRPIDAIILTKLGQHKGVLEGVGAELGINPSTIGRWMAQLDIQAEVDLIRVTNGLAALYLDGEVNDHWLLWNRIKPSINGPCQQCKVIADNLGDMWFTGVATVHDSMLVTGRDKQGKGHQFPMDINVYNSQFTTDHISVESGKNSPDQPNPH